MTTFGSVMSTPLPSILMVLPLTVQLPTGWTPGVSPRLTHAVASVAAELIVTVLVPGVTENVGIGYDTACGSGIVLPVMTAEPVSESDVTAPSEQLPTPVRGVYRLPCTSTLPWICRFPLVPTSPPLSVMLLPAPVGGPCRE